jgi:hypothetical protein
MKKKGDKPHYKPGTDKKFKKYQEESVQNGKVDLTLKTDVNNVLKQDNKEYDRGLLAQVNKDGSYDVAYWYDKYKAYPVEVEIDGKTCAKDAKNIHIKFHPELKKESFEIDKTAHKAAQKKQKMRNLAKGNTNPNEKAAAEKKAGGPKLYGEDIVRVEGQLGYVEFIDLIKPEPMKGVKVIDEKAVSKKQQKFFGMVRAAQKGEGAASPEVAKVASEISKKDAKDFAKTKHKGLPEKKLTKEELATHIKKGVAAARPLVKANVLQSGLPSKEKPKTPEKKDSKSVFKQLTNKDEID